VVFAFCWSGAVGIGGAERTGCGCMSPDCMRTGRSGVQTVQVVKSSVHGLDECRAEREKLRTVRGLGECRSVSSDSSYMLRMRDSLGDMHACMHHSATCAEWWSSGMHDSRAYVVCSDTGTRVTKQAVAE